MKGDAIAKLNVNPDGKKTIERSIERGGRTGILFCFFGELECRKFVRVRHHKTPKRKVYVDRWSVENEALSIEEGTYVFQTSELLSLPSICTSIASSEETRATHLLTTSLNLPFPIQPCFFQSLERL